MRLGVLIICVRVIFSAYFVEAVMVETPAMDSYGQSSFLHREIGLEMRPDWK
jgi:hypothetical protein